MLRLRTLGGLSVENAVFIGGTAARRRPLALLALLAVAGQRGLSRDRIISLLWPESDDERARNSLSQALSTLRRELRVDDITIGTVELRLNPHVITSDVQEFERALSEGSRERAVSLYAGSFLDGAFIKDAPGFEEWASRERARLQHAQAESLELLAKDASVRGNHHVAVGYWRRLAALEPTSARVTVGLMEAVASFGDSAGALRHYAIHEALMQQDNNCEPEASVQAAAARIRENLNELPPSVYAAPRTSPDSTTSLGPGVETSRALPALASPANNRPLARGRYVSRTIAAAILIAAVTAGVITYLPNDSPRVEQRRILVAPFDDLTGDSSLGPLSRVAAGWVSEGLARTALVHVVDPGSSRAAAGIASRTKGDHLAEIRAIGKEVGAGLIVLGAYHTTGDSLYMRSRIVDTRSGEVLREVEPVRGTTRAPMSAVESLRSRVMGALASIVDSRFASVITASTTPPNYEAYRAYIDGLESFWHQHYREAIAKFAESRRLDSGFVLPLIWMQYAYGNAGSAERRDSVLDVLALSRDALPPAEQHGLDALLARRRHDVPAELKALREASALAPQSNWAYTLGSRLVSADRPREAVEVLQPIDAYHGWVRGWPAYWIVLTEAYHRRGDYRSQLGVTRKAMREFPEVLHLQGLELSALASLDRADDVNAIVQRVLSARFDSLGPGPGEFMHAAALEYLAHGHRDHGRAMARRCADWRGWAAYGKVAGRGRLHAECFYLAERFADAESLYREVATWAASSGILSDRSTRINATARLGVLAAKRSDRVEALTLSAMLDTVPLYSGSAQIAFAQARIAIALGDRERAIALLQRGMATGEALAWLGEHDVDYAPLRGYGPFDALARPRDESGVRSALHRIALLTRR